MLDNKIFVNIYILVIDKSFDVYIPINEKVGNILNLFKNNCCETYGLDSKKEFALLNLTSGKLYDYNTIIRDTDIDNDTKLLLI